VSGCALLAVLAALAVGCSKKNGAPFDPDAGHPDRWIATHPDAYRSEGGGTCSECHGHDLLGGISTVSCFSASHNNQGCHEGGPGGHPPGWRALHSADPSKAATCAPCHDNSSNNLAPNCFDNSLCHGPKAGHPPGWLSAHKQSNPSLASSCAECHQNRAGTPGCFNNTLCHGTKNAHPAGWLQSHSGSNQNQASVCAACHQSAAGTPGCFNNTLCHGAKSAQHPAGWRTAHQSTSPAGASACAGCHPNIGTPTCFTNTSCHGGGGGHPAGWAAGSQHGTAAKSAPGGASGFVSCQACHGAGLDGGSSLQSCQINSGCHGWGAPHASTGWRGGGGSHKTTNVGNVSVCARCHNVSAPPSGTTCSHNDGAAGQCHGD
jgi:hypothetical protein